MTSASEQLDSYCWNLFIGSSVYSHQKSDFWRLATADSGEEIANSEYQGVGVNITRLNWDRNQLVTLEPENWTKMMLTIVTGCTNRRNSMYFNFTAYHQGEFMLYYKSLCIFRAHKLNSKFETILFNLSYGESTSSSPGFVFLSQQISDHTRMINQTFELETDQSYLRYSPNFWLTSRSNVTRYFPLKWKVLSSTYDIINEGEFHEFNYEHYLSMALDKTMIVRIESIEAAFFNLGEIQFEIFYDNSKKYSGFIGETKYSQDISVQLNDLNNQIQLGTPMSDRVAPVVTDSNPDACQALYLFINTLSACNIEYNITCTSQNLNSVTSNPQCAQLKSNSIALNAEYKRIEVSQICSSRDGMPKYKLLLGLKGTEETRLSWGLFYNGLWLVKNITSANIDQTREIVFTISPKSQRPILEKVVLLNVKHSKDSNSANGSQGYSFSDLIVAFIIGFFVCALALLIIKFLLKYCKKQRERAISESGLNSHTATLLSPRTQASSNVLGPSRPKDNVRF